MQARYQGNSLFHPAFPCIDEAENVSRCCMQLVQLCLFSNGSRKIMFAFITALFFHSYWELDAPAPPPAPPPLPSGLVLGLEGAQSTHTRMFEEIESQARR